MAQMTKSVRMRGMNLLHFVLMVAVMTIAWLTMYSPSIEPQTAQITTTAVLLCYLVLSVFLYQTYNAYKIGMYRAGETFYSLTLANLIGNALTYLFACLIQSRLLNCVPVLFVLVAQTAISGLWCLAANQIYINRMSLAEDLKLIFATIKILLMKESTQGVEQGQTTAEKTEKAVEKSA